jgi:peptidoglycan/xylan/chitin deacetylase (PgdA/CDA1 family)
MGANFIVSFDCEGKWGMADRITPHHTACLTTKRLNEAYSRLIEILDENEIKASFAFVGAFSMSCDEYYENKDWFSDIFVNGRNWFSSFNESASKKQFEGWFAPTTFEQVLNSGAHEIASHGFSHLPLAESLIRKKDFFREMELIKRVAQLRGVSPKSFIYPRNQVGFVDELLESGFAGYRGSLEDKTKSTIMNRLENLWEELNSSPSPQDHPVTDKIIKIPAGYFLNWRFGLRKRIPFNLTYKKWAHLIADAIQRETVVHLWTHPHNFIDGDNMYSLFDKILKLARNAVKRNELVNLTQMEYVKNRLSLKID